MSPQDLRSLLIAAGAIAPAELRQPRRKPTKAVLRLDDLALRTIKRERKQREQNERVEREQ